MPLYCKIKYHKCKKHKNIKIKGKIKVLFIASHHQDEPLADAIKAINYLNDTDIYLYVTGDYKKVNKIRLDAPKNVVFTGFIDDKEFINLVYAVDIILVLTKNENFLLCGCYEAIGAEKPLITSNTRTLKEYFTSAVFVNNNFKEIALAIECISKNINKYQMEIKFLKSKLKKNWRNQSKRLELIIQKNNNYTISQ